MQITGLKVTLCMDCAIRLTASFPVVWTVGLTSAQCNCGWRVQVFFNCNQFAVEDRAKQLRLAKTRQRLSV